MRALVKQQKLNEIESVGAKKKKKLSKRAKLIDVEAEKSAEFNLDLADERFKPLFEDPKFGIDLTSSEFKQTALMKDVLAEQANRHAKAQKNKSVQVDSEMKVETKISDLDNIDRSHSSDVAQLVSRLKKRLKS